MHFALWLVLFSPTHGQKQEEFSKSNATYDLDRIRYNKLRK